MSSEDELADKYISMVCPTGLVNYLDRNALRSHIKALIIEARQAYSYTSNDKDEFSRAYVALKKLTMFLHQNHTFTCDYVPDFLVHIGVKK